MKAILRRKELKELVCIIQRLIMLMNEGLTYVINYVVNLRYGDLVYICVSCASRCVSIFRSTGAYITTYDIYVHHDVLRALSLRGL